jgi:histidyl-tRNA synthetase
VPSDEKRNDAAVIATQLRERGMNVELYHSAQKIKKQMEYAVRKGIPFVWFPPFEDGQPHEVKSMHTGEQIQADPKTWKGAK